MIWLVDQRISTPYNTSVSYSFVRADAHDIPHKTTVIDVDEETGRVLLEYVHGQTEWVEPNILQEALLSRDANDDGTNLWTFSTVLDHKTENNQVQVKIQWDNGDVTWEPLNSLRKDDPVTLAKYAHKKGITNKRGWKWSRKINKRPKKLLRMLRINASQKGAARKTVKYKFGVQIPKHPMHALELDRLNGNTKWRDALQLEIDQLLKFETFLIYEKGEIDLKNYTYVPLLMVFDVKFDGRHKCRYVANGSVTDELGDDIYSGVVGIDSVWIALLLAQLNGLQVCAGDVSCAFLQSQCKEKIYTIAGPEFGPKLQGKVLVMNKSIYGLRSASASFHEHCARVLHKIGFKPSHADPDLWMKDCKTHYEYVATWVDDVLVMSKEPLKVIQDFKEAGEYELKGVGAPEYYLRGDLQQRKVDDYTCYETHAKTYITRITDKIEKLMEWTLRSYMSPEDPNYAPELDETPLLGPEQHSQYRMIIGSLNWLVTLGRYDIYHAASTMARYGMAPREGHLNATKRILGYLRAYPKISIRYDARLPDFSKYKTTTYDWFRSYPEAAEALPHNMPEPRGEQVKLWGYFDASHASCLKTRRSVTGILLFINSCPIHWYCKRQNTVETSTYGSELIAGRIAVESIIDFRYRLRMLGVPLDGSSVLFGDNQSMIMNTTVPGSALKKRHSAVAYHRIREAVASGIVNIIHCRSETNLSDILTKPLGPQTFQRLVKHEKFPPRLMHEGELNGETVNEQSVTKTKHGRLEITWPQFERDLIDALEDENFVNNVVRMERKIRESMVTTGYTNT